MIRATLFCFATIAVAACSGNSDPKHALLDHFIDAYIHHADPAAARAFAAGDALAKLNSEVAGVAGQEKPSTFPDVDFKITDERMSHDSVTFELELKINSGGQTAFTRDLLVTGLQMQGEWKVVEFVFLR